jgi:hypothetical protein
MTDARVLRSAASRARGEPARLSDNLQAENQSRQAKAASRPRQTVRWWITIALLCCTTLGGGWQIWEAIKVYDPVRQQATASANTVTGRRQQRAVVGYQPGPVFLMNDKNNRPSFAFSMTFQNFGGTRTSKFHAWHSVQYFENGVPNSLDLSKPWGNIEAVTGSVVGPNNPIVMEPLSVSAEESARALKKNGTILQWGYGEYADIFEPNKFRHLRFCYVMEPAATPNGPSSFQPVPFQNDCNRNE